MLIKVGSLYLTLGTFTYHANTREIQIHGMDTPLYPDIAKLLSSPLAPKVVGRIQEHLKKKGNENAG
jgi:hypothetical protein